jgi:hypothetical protein
MGAGILSLVGGPIGGFLFYNFVKSSAGAGLSIGVAAVALWLGWRGSSSWKRGASLSMSSRGLRWVTKDGAAVSRGKTVARELLGLSLPAGVLLGFSGSCRSVYTGLREWRRHSSRYYYWDGQLLM